MFLSLFMSCSFLLSSLMKKVHREHSTIIQTRTMFEMDFWHVRAPLNRGALLTQYQKTPKPVFFLNMYVFDFQLISRCFFQRAQRSIYFSFLERLKIKLYALSIDRFFKKHSENFSKNLVVYFSQQAIITALVQLYIALIQKITAFHILFLKR